MIILFVFSMKRSGQHAIINWICEQSLSAIHFNSCLYKNDEILLANEFYTYNKKFQKHIVGSKYNIEEHNLVVFNFEDKPVYDLRERKNFLFDAKEITSTIVRDPFNLISSRMKSYGNPRWNKDIWKNHILYNGEVINYNEWCKNKGYRKNLILNLGFEFTDNGYDDIEGRAGSSFDMKKYHGKASKMKTSERWKLYTNNKSYRSVFDNEIKNISKKYFNIQPF